MCFMISCNFQHLEQFLVHNKCSVNISLNECFLVAFHTLSLLVFVFNLQHPCELLESIISSNPQKNSLR